MTPLNSPRLDWALGARCQAPERPRLPEVRVRRERLLLALQQAPRRLSLLCAPAGYGKTLLLNEASRGLAQPPLWLSLGGEQPALPEVMARLAAQLNEPDLADRGPEHMLEALRQRGDICLVLDDYPACASAELDQWVERLLALASPGLRVWVSARRRPVWNLLRLTLDGELLELGPQALGFAREEFESLAQAMVPTVADAEREEVWQLTQGWCAGARLGLDLPGAGNRPLPQRLFVYLDNQLLPRLSEGGRKVLLGLAHLPRAAQELCAQLWPELDGGRILVEELLPLSLFLPLDEEARWWRLLPAVARALASGPQDIGLNRLRLDCCRQLRAAGLHDEAVEMALSAGQAETAASFMDRLSLDWLFHGRHMANWLDWRARLPLPLLESTPFLIYLNAQVLLSSWRLDEAQACIDRLGDQLPQPQAAYNRRMLANWQALHGTLRGLQGDAEAAREHCTSALDYLSARDWQSAYLCYSTLARVAMAGGEPARAEQLLDTALELSRRQGCLASEVLIETDRIRLLILTGRLAEARARLQECLELVQQSGADYGMLLGRLHLLRGELALLAADLPAARQALTLGQAHARECADPFLLHGGIGLAEVAACLGEHDVAAAHLRDVERRMQVARIDPACYEAVIGQQRLRGLLRQGQWSPVLPVARALASACRTGRRLPPLHAPSLPQRIQLLLVLALQGAGELREAEQACRELLGACERLQFAGLLLEARLAHQRILQVPPEERTELHESSLVRACPAALGEAPPSAGNERLTPREFSVLELLAEGLSNQEIGERLYISLNTVKAHTIRINHKLGVKRRTQAVMRARSLGMLA
ncbi:LuxR C-terminal-related transcriptional regulator [Pseudomonas nitroreducens]|uniref:helix-turn-helix transcriptional regulator n=1 Tax=Pseudomonas nitroreducens TaxID=46680 RepID=UPI003CC830E8